MLNTFEKTKAHEARRAAIQRQMEAMEAAASTGRTAPAGAGSPDGSTGGGAARRRSPPAPAGSLETARRFLWDEGEGGEEAAAAGTGMTPANKGGDSYSYKSNPQPGGFMSKLFGPSTRNINAAASMKNVNLNEPSTSAAPKEYRPSIFTSCYIFFRNLLLTCALSIGQCCSKSRECVEMALGGGRGKKLCIALIVILLVCIPVTIWTQVRDDESESTSRSGSALSPADRLEEIRGRIVDEGISDLALLNDPSSPQGMALDWIVNKDPADLDTNHAYITQRYALAVFYFSTHGDNMFQTAVINITETIPPAEADTGDATRIGDEDTAPMQLPADGEVEVVGDDLAGQDNWMDETGWMTEQGHCAWYGIECHHRPGTSVYNTHYDGNHGVILVNMTENNVRGSVPREVFKACPDIRWISLAGNGFFGTLPTEITKLNQLRYLSLANNFFTGTLPPAITTIPDLNRLYMDGNFFKGHLPANIGNMTNLLSLSIFDNYFTGTIPRNIGNLNNLTALYIDINHLTGTLPTTLGRLTDMVDFRLRHNRFEGSIPTEIGLMEKMEILYLDRNDLTGTIPTQMGLVTRLTELHLYRNKLVGSIPTEFGALPDLTSLYLDNNHLSGDIPTEFGRLNDLEQVYLHKNRLNGTIPTEIGQMEELRNFRVYTNGMVGTLPSEIGNCYNLQHVYVHDNLMEGTIPEQVAELSKLQNLRTYWNRMDGEVPEAICDLLELQLTELKTDCAGDEPKVECSCCTVCFT